MADNKQTDTDKSRGDAEPALAEAEKKHHAETVVSALEKANQVSRSPKKALDRWDPLRSLRVHNDALASLVDRRDALGALARFQDSTDSIASLRDTGRALADIGQRDAVLATALDDMTRLARIPEVASRLWFGPLRELETAAFATSLRAITADHERFRTIAEQAARQFRMPEFNETTRLLAEIQSRNEAALDSLSVYNDSMKRAMDAITGAVDQH